MRTRKTDRKYLRGKRVADSLQRFIISCEEGAALKIMDDNIHVDVGIAKSTGKKVKLAIEAPLEVGVQLQETYRKLESDRRQILEICHFRDKRHPNTFEYFTKEECSSSARVLLVEDSEIIRKAHSGFIQSLGCVVDVAEDGRKALDMLYNHYDLILLDVDLPDISGIEVCRSIRRRNVYSKLPIIFFTGHGEAIRESCRAAGGNDFIAKPCAIKKLLALIMNYLPVKK